MALKFIIIFFIVFFVLLIFVLPKVLYIATMIYYALFKSKQDRSGEVKHYSIKEIKEFKKQR